jgi:2-keto-4-pentenoate hydratase/2-oxohepta-3-ene-1,7-dioic acid hydratase in catechol pathway
MGFQGELVVVIGKKCKNLGPEDDVFDYILGYTIGNDLSSRYWQNPDRSCGQHAYGKSFDQFAPIGPVLASSSVISDPSNLHLETFVNGEKRQSASTADMIFKIPQIIHHLSRGTTLEPGTAIFTGTPAGVAIFMENPLWLKSGDVVDIRIDGIGKIANNFRIAQ